MIVNRNVTPLQREIITNTCISDKHCRSIGKSSQCNIQEDDEEIEKHAVYQINKFDNLLQEETTNFKYEINPRDSYYPLNSNSVKILDELFFGDVFNDTEDYKDQDNTIVCGAGKGKENSSNISTVFNKEQGDGINGTNHDINSNSTGNVECILSMENNTKGRIAKIPDTLPPVVNEMNHRNCVETSANTTLQQSDSNVHKSSKTVQKNGNISNSNTVSRKSKICKNKKPTIQTENSFKSRVLRKTPLKRLQPPLSVTQKVNAWASSKTVKPSNKKPVKQKVNNFQNYQEPVTKISAINKELIKLGVTRISTINHNLRENKICTRQGKYTRCLRSHNNRKEKQDENMYNMYIKHKTMNDYSAEEFPSRRKTIRTSPKLNRRNESHHKPESYSFLQIGRKKRGRPKSQSLFYIKKSFQTIPDLTTQNFIQNPTLNTKVSNILHTSILNDNQNVNSLSVKPNFSTNTAVVNKTTPVIIAKLKPSKQPRKYRKKENQVNKLQKSVTPSECYEHHQEVTSVYNIRSNNNHHNITPEVECVLNNELETCYKSFQINSSSVLASVMDRQNFYNDDISNSSLETAEMDNIIPTEVSVTDDSIVTTPCMYSKQHISYESAQHTEPQELEIKSNKVPVYNKQKITTININRRLTSDNMKTEINYKDPVIEKPPIDMLKVSNNKLHPVAVNLQNMDHISSEINLVQHSQLETYSVKNNVACTNSNIKDMANVLNDTHIQGNKRDVNKKQSPSIILSSMSNTPFMSFEQTNKYSMPRNSNSTNHVTKEAWPKWQLNVEKKSKVKCVSKCQSDYNNKPCQNHSQTAHNKIENDTSNIISEIRNTEQINIYHSNNTRELLPKSQLETKYINKNQVNYNNSITDYNNNNQNIYNNNKLKNKIKTCNITDTQKSQISKSRNKTNRKTQKKLEVKYIPLNVSFNKSIKSDKFDDSQSKTSVQYKKKNCYDENNSHANSSLELGLINKISKQSNFTSVYPEGISSTNEVMTDIKSKYGKIDKTLIIDKQSNVWSNDYLTKNDLCGNIPRNHDSLSSDTQEHTEYNDYQSNEVFTHLLPKNNLNTQTVAEFKGFAGSDVKEQKQKSELYSSSIKKFVKTEKSHYTKKNCINQSTKNSNEIYKNFTSATVYQNKLNISINNPNFAKMDSKKTLSSIGDDETKELCKSKEVVDLYTQENQDISFLSAVTVSNTDKHDNNQCVSKDHASIRNSKPKNICSILGQINPELEPDIIYSSQPQCDTSDSISIFLNNNVCLFDKPSETHIINSEQGVKIDNKHVTILENLDLKNVSEIGKVCNQLDRESKYNVITDSSTQLQDDLFIINQMENTHDYSGNNDTKKYILKPCNDSIEFEGAKNSEENELIGSKVHPQKEQTPKMTNTEDKHNYLSINDLGKKNNKMGRNRKKRSSDMKNEQKVSNVTSVCQKNKSSVDTNKTKKVNRWTKQITVQCTSNESNKSENFDITDVMVTQKNDVDESEIQKLSCEFNQCLSMSNEEITVHNLTVENWYKFYFSPINENTSIKQNNVNDHQAKNISNHIENKSVDIENLSNSFDKQLVLKTKLDAQKEIDDSYEYLFNSLFSNSANSCSNLNSKLKGNIQETLSQNSNLSTFLCKSICTEESQKSGKELNKCHINYDDFSCASVLNIQSIVNRVKFVKTKLPFFVPITNDSKDLFPNDWLKDFDIWNI